MKAFPFFCIYGRPTDYPGKFVVRVWAPIAGMTHGPGTFNYAPAPEPHAVVDSLEEARQSVPGGLACVPRQGDDDPAIVEIWL